MATNEHIGSSFDDFLEEDGILDECAEAAAFERVLQRQRRAFFDRRCSSHAHAAPILRSGGRLPAIGAGSARSSNRPS